MQSGEELGHHACNTETQCLSSTLPTPRPRHLPTRRARRVICHLTYRSRVEAGINHYITGTNTLKISLASFDSGFISLPLLILPSCLSPSQSTHMAWPPSEEAGKSTFFVAVQCVLTSNSPYVPGRHLIRHLLYLRMFNLFYIHFFCMVPQARALMSGEGRRDERDQILFSSFPSTSRIDRDLLFSSCISS